MRALDLWMTPITAIRRAYGFCFFVYVSAGKHTHIRTEGVILSSNDRGSSAKKARRECSPILGIRPTFRLAVEGER